jgi:hypothetical protein
MSPVLSPLNIHRLCIPAVVLKVDFKTLNFKALKPSDRCWCQRSKRSSCHREDTMVDLRIHCIERRIANRRNNNNNHTPCTYPASKKHIDTAAENDENSQNTTNHPLVLRFGDGTCCAGASEPCGNYYNSDTPRRCVCCSIVIDRLCS